MAELFYRAANYETADLKDGERKIPVSFSSETPCMNSTMPNGKGEVIMEILDHSPENIDMSYARNGLPLILSHEDKDALAQVGIVDEIKFEGGRGMGVSCFETGDVPERMFQSVRSRIRKAVSVGYERTKVISTQVIDGMKHVRFAWMPVSVSIVPVPADHTVGFGRSNQTKEIIMPDEIKPAAANTGPTITAEDIAKARTEAANFTRDRFNKVRTTIKKLCENHPAGRAKFEEIGDAFISNDKPLEDFQSELMLAIPGTRQAPIISCESLGMDENDKNRFSLGRAIRYCIEHNGSPDGMDGVEGVTHRAMYERNRTNTGVSMQGGILVPFDIPMGRTGRRDMTATGGMATGGALVPTILQPNLIELLRNRTVTDRAGIQTLSGLSGNVALPRHIGPATAYSLAETAIGVASDGSYDQLTLTPHRAFAEGDYSKQFLLQSALGAENLVRDDLMKTLGILVDKQILEGTGGANQLLGVMNTPGINTVTFGGAATWANILAFETALGAANADIGTMAWVTDATARGRWKAITKIAASVTPIFLWDGTMGDGSNDGIVNGYRAMVSNQIAAHRAAFAVWSEVVHALWGGFDIVVDPYTRASAGVVRIIINMFHDVIVRHPAAVCWSTDTAAA